MPSRFGKEHTLSLQSFSVVAEVCVWHPAPSGRPSLPLPRVTPQNAWGVVYKFTLKERDGAARKPQLTELSFRGCMPQGFSRQRSVFVVGEG